MHYPIVMQVAHNIEQAATLVELQFETVYSEDHVT